MKKLLFFAITILMATSTYGQNWKKLAAENQTMDWQVARQIKTTHLCPLFEGKIDATATLIRKTASDEMPITEQPNGKLFDNTYNSSEAYFEAGFGQAMYTEMDGTLGAYVKDDKGNVYIKNIFSKLRTDTWAKGTMRGDTLYIATPQLIAIQADKNGQEAKYYLHNMTLNENETNFIIDSLNTEIKFVFHGDTLQQVSKGLVGLTTARGGWTGFGDFNIIIVPQTDIPVETPLGLVTDLYVLSYANTYGTRSGVLCQAGKLGDKFYLGELCDEMGDKWIVGKVNGNKMRIDMPQYLGADEDHGYHLYAFGGTAQMRMDEETQRTSEHIAMTQQLEFDINENGTISTDSLLILNLGRNKFYYLYGYRQPILKKYELRAGTPERAIFTDYMMYTSMDGYGGVKFVLPEFTTEGDFMDIGSLYYNIYFDGQLYTFTPDKYTKLSEPMTDVPATFTDNFDFITKGNVRTVYYYHNDFQKVGVQMVYKYGGETHRSSIMYLDTQVIDNIQDLEAEKKVKSVAYYDLSGRKTSALARGLIVKVTKMEDGTVKTQKLINQ